MATTTRQTKRNRMSRGQRTHVRRMKQEAGRSSVPHKQVKKPARPAEAPKP